MATNNPAAPTPQFFAPAPAPARPATSHFVSAPVNREVPAGGNRTPELNPRQMTLSVEENEIAKASEISPVEYARNKMRMLKERAAGLRD